jgi:fumarylacetoacetase
VIDLDVLVGAGVLDEESLRGAQSLNDFLARGRAVWTAVRRRLQHVLDPAAGNDERVAVNAASIPRAGITEHLPVAIGDYVDFLLIARARDEPRPHPAPRR